MIVLDTPHNDNTHVDCVQVSWGFDTNTFQLTWAYGTMDGENGFVPSLEEMTPTETVLGDDGAVWDATKALATLDGEGWYDASKRLACQYLLDQSVVDGQLV